MDRDRALAVVSTAQLALGVWGMSVAIHRRHAYDLPVLHGRPDQVVRDAVFVGTALSAPAAMLVAQGWVTARLARGSTGARRILGGLGAVMVVGYTGERLVRTRLRPSAWDATESPLIALGFSLAAVMAALGLPRRQG